MTALQVSSQPKPYGKTNSCRSLLPSRFNARKRVECWNRAAARQGKGVTTSGRKPRQGNIE
jgi:hypothetical protein